MSGNTTFLIGTEDEKGGVLVMPRIDFFKRYDSVSMASSEAPTGLPEEAQTLWGRKTW
jgi:uncharacterized protein YaaQ